MYGVGIGIVLAIVYIVALSVVRRARRRRRAAAAARRVGAEYPVRRRRRLHGADRQNLNSTVAFAAGHGIRVLVPAFRIS